ncbi:YeeE/YedE family protein [Parvibaculum sp.]|uniref:YeeE/YedE family protein n=1 Tax=Parvibaculum sp. TaxID=2024848 RepID=UPI00320E2AA7
MEIFATAAIGGILIGAAAAGLLLVNGSIAGISGVFGNALTGKPGLWRWAFLAGLIAAPLVAPFAKIEVPVPHHQAGLITLAIAGLLVGIGTRLSGGCTSGHGVCGLSNLSLRSLTATGTFMVVAALTVYAVRHLGLPVGY